MPVDCPTGWAPDQIGTFGDKRMSIIAKSALRSVPRLAGVAVAAHAQSGSVAALRPGTVATTPATAPIGPSVTYPGPNPGSGYYGATVTQQAPVAASPQYVGPSPGAGSGSVPPKFNKSADYDSDPAMHPYTNSTPRGPPPH